jgi:predicted dehydrogenase (TIGR03970 family)
MIPTDCDVLIVGGGTAGCVLAARLSEDADRRVVLIEAGRDLQNSVDLPPVLVGHPPLSAGELPDAWRYDVELCETPSRRMAQFRGRILGGSSSINGSLFIRGIPEDYASWGSELWTYPAVLPYFRQSETDLDFRDDYHGVQGPLRVSRAQDQPLSANQQRLLDRALSLGIPQKADLNNPRGGGIGRVPMTLRSRSTALTYVANCRQRPNLTLLTDAVVARVVVDGDRAAGVEVLRGNTTALVRAGEVVLCAGTFGSAELLLRSGIGAADHLHPLGIPVIVDLPGVGANLRCHPMLTLHFPMESGGEIDPETPRLALIQSTRARNDLMVFPKRTRDELAIMSTLRLPTSSGALRLRSADRCVASDIRYQYLEPDDLACLREGLGMAVDLAQRQPAEDVTDEWVLEHLETADHASGTCKMGPPEDPLAVVDDHCRVRGVGNLRVVDLSIVPQPVRAGPYPTVVMLAECAAALIDPAIAPVQPRREATH